MFEAVTLGLLMAACWMLWDLRQALHVPPPVRLPGRSTPTLVREADFQGAIPPNRYVVVRWPQGRLEYQGTSGSAARQVYERTPPAPGEAIEFWELGDRRGYKER